MWLSATEYGFCLWKSPPECINHCARAPATTVTYTVLYGISPRRIGRGHGDGRQIVGGATAGARVRYTRSYRVARASADEAASGNGAAAARRSTDRWREERGEQHRALRRRRAPVVFGWSTILR